jgi:hypothetical protein
MSGLYTRFNLSEDGLNAVDALQKLYGPQIQEDVNLFAFADTLESAISSASTGAENQILGLVNEPFSDSVGNVFLRTKFITNNYTFSDDNQVWIDRGSGSSLDRRTTSETSGAPIKISVNGSLTSVSVAGIGIRYEVRDANGDEIGSYPATAVMSVVGVESGASNATVLVTVSSDGTLSRDASVVSGGSGYRQDEFLQLVPACGQDDEPTEDKCKRYTTNYVYQEPFEAGEVSYPALLKNERYTYRVRISSIEGFFLYDDKESDWVYLGSDYNDQINISPSQIPLVVLKRKDTISSNNLTKLFRLNGRSLFYSYEESYEPEQGISGNLRSLSNRVEELRDAFKDFVQNTRLPREVGDETNDLGIQTNITPGKNITSDYRVIFRDPDSVLDDSGVDFFSLQGLDQPEKITLNGINIPGIWLFTGDKYQRVFSSDDKPFFSQSGRNYLSPRLFELDGANNIVGVGETGENKYSISTGYLRPGTTVIRGFDTVLGTLIQNVSNQSGQGGFVFHRQLQVSVVNSGQGISSWPLLSYREGSNTVRDARFLAI